MKFDQYADLYALHMCRLHCGLRVGWFALYGRLLIQITCIFLVELGAQWVI